MITGFVIPVEDSAAARARQILERNQYHSLSPFWNTLRDDIARAIRDGEREARQDALKQAIELVDRAYGPNSVIAEQLVSLLTTIR